MPTPSQLGRTGPLPRTAWTDRVRVLADSSRLPVAGLAELVEAELGRVAGVLFTATPAEDLDEISRWGRLADAAWCGQVRAVVAAHNRMSASEREFLSCEVALALNLSPGAASDLVGTALLAADAPGLVEAVEAGLLTVRHLHAVLGALQGAGLSTEEQHAVVTIALVRYDRHTPAELGTLVRTLMLQVHPAASAAKEQDATYRRRVTFRAVQDGRGCWSRAARSRSSKRSAPRWRPACGPQAPPAPTRAMTGPGTRSRSTCSPSSWSTAAQPRVSRWRAGPPPS